MEINTKLMLRILNVVSWIIFIGVLVDAGILIAGVLLTWFMKLTAPGKFWIEPNLTALFQADRGHYLAQTLMMMIVAILKGLLFYVIVKMLSENKLNMAQPFSREVGRFIFLISYITLSIGLFSAWGTKYAKWLITEGFKLPEMSSLRLDGGDVWLFMSVTLFVIAHIFKRGIEIQNENELTV